ncbi:helix-turn-helix domain-containing protein [Psychroserpens luteolus]|uniref:helix-turn-helix domain-containing protein n=1 Tax=Psychroserpens luteolus TaxID=2855840 RepID=UPI001E4AB06A|nr:helix-turn-helix domain-containing protein [Psychroserpens luteolus]MCD2258051.1 helix-turn-helix domain-containing protein [Psychroserpens luteolus]
MSKTFTEFSTNAILNVGDAQLLSKYSSSKPIGLYTFVWATNSPIKVIVDGIPLTLEPHQILSLTAIQYFQFVEGSDVIVYQFNREFYCIKDHDKEVGCAGLLFFGNEHIPIITLNTTEQQKFSILHEVFLDELETTDTIQAEMLRMLMARFIIKTTRLLKSSSDETKPLKGSNDTLRHFNFLVETHYKQEHSVSFYAEKLNKSPKTLSNSFSKYQKSPLQIIHDRIVLETKRQLLYTDKSSKEIAYDIGFDDASHLSRLFKKQTSLTPSEFKKGSKLYV